VTGPRRDARRAPHRYEVLRALRRVNFPGVPVGRRHVGPGEAAWLAADLWWTEWAAVLLWLGRRDLLVASPPGRARLRRWLNRRWARPVVDEWGESHAAQLRMYGDSAMVPPVLHAFARMPRSVSDMISEESYVLLAGARLRGWTSGPLDVDGLGLCPILVTGSTWDDIVGCALHEAAHRWHRPGAPAVMGPTIAAYEAMLTTARREGWPVDAVEARAAADEELAKHCETAWSIEP